MIITFFIMGILEAAFIWVLTLNMSSLIGIDGEVINVETQESYIFYFLLGSY